MIVCAQLPDSAGQFAGVFCVSKLIDYNEKAGTVVVLFAREQYTVPITNVRYVARDMTEAVKMSNQQEAIERIKQALLEHRKARTIAERTARKPAGNRYASISQGSHAAPSPTRPAADGRGSQQALPLEPPKAAPPAKALRAPRRETKPERKPRSASSAQRFAAGSAVRQAQRLSNAHMELYFPMGVKITAKLPNGVVDVVETDKPFGKIFRK